MAAAKRPNVEPLKVFQASSHFSVHLSLPHTICMRVSRSKTTVVGDSVWSCFIVKFHCCWWAVKVQYRTRHGHCNPMIQSLNTWPRPWLKHHVDASSADLARALEALVTEQPWMLLIRNVRVCTARHQDNA